MAQIANQIVYGLLLKLKQKIKDKRKEKKAAVKPECVAPVFSRFGGSCAVLSLYPDAWGDQIICSGG